MSQFTLKEVVDELKKLSDVTPKSKFSFFKTPVFKVVILLSLLFLSFAYFAKAPKVANEEVRTEEALKTNHRGLDDNLSHLQQLKEQQVLKEKEAARAAFLASRRPDYASTPSGESIGNPVSYQNAPFKKARMDEALKSRMAAKTTFFNRQGVNPINTQVSSGGNETREENQIAFAEALRIAHPEYVLTAGMSIDATLEVAVNSQLPGIVRAITAQDIYSTDASHLLIPKGSELFGQYDASNIGAAQDRLLISWLRVKLPNGIIANLNSPSVDGLGRTGLSLRAPRIFFDENEKAQRQKEACKHRNQYF